MSSRSMPLHGISIAVTRAEHRSHTLRSLLAQSGAKVLLLPTIAIHEVNPTPKQALLLRETTQQACDLAFTSVEAVRGFLRHLSISYPNTQIPSWNYIYTVGSRTESELSESPLQALKHYKARPSNDAGLGTLIRNKSKLSTPIIAPAGTAARQSWSDLLRDQGFNIIRPLVYETRDYLPDSTPLVDAVDSVTYFSPSAVHAWHRVYPTIKVGCAAAIGPTTAEACTKYGIHVAVVAEHPTEETLVDAVVRYSDVSRR